MKLNMKSGWVRWLRGAAVLAAIPPGAGPSSGGGCGGSDSGANRGQTSTAQQPRQVDDPPPPRDEATSEPETSTSGIRQPPTHPEAAPRPALP